MVAMVYMWVACLLCNGVLVEDTKAPETAVPTLQQQQQGSGERRRGKQRDSGSSKPTVPATGGIEDPSMIGTHYSGSGVYDPDDLQMGCTELRSKRYISDGFCTSIKPITEVVCAGECLPLDNGQLPFYARYLKVWSREKTKEYRCVNDVVRQKRVHLICDNNERRTYRIRTVRSCKCKRYNREHNKSQLWDNVSSTTNNNNNDNRGARSKSSLERESSRDQRRRARQSQKSGRTRA